jgi:hypothetical protein
MAPGMTARLVDRSSTEDRLLGVRCSGRKRDGVAVQQAAGGDGFEAGIGRPREVRALQRIQRLYRTDRA